MSGAMTTTRKESPSANCAHPVSPRCCFLLRRLSLHAPHHNERGPRWPDRLSDIEPNFVRTAWVFVSALQSEQFLPLYVEGILPLTNTGASEKTYFENTFPELSPDD